MATKARERTVSDVMSAPALTATPSETVAEASQRMVGADVGSVVVVDGDRPIGILTERDLIRFGASGLSGEASKVSEWMTEDPDVVAPDLNVQVAYDRLSEQGYRHFPVVEDGTLIGLVSLRDLMKMASIQPVLDPGEIEAPPGLAGVIVAETEVGDVRGLEGFYHYRQYNAVELAATRSLEDVWRLLFDGSLPNAAEREAFVDEIRPLRRVPDSVRDVLPTIADDVLVGDGGVAHGTLARRCGVRHEADPRHRPRTSAGPTPCACVR